MVVQVVELWSFAFQLPKPLVLEVVVDVFVCSVLVVVVLLWVLR